MKKTDGTCCFLKGCYHVVGALLWFPFKWRIFGGFQVTSLITLGSPASSGRKGRCEEELEKIG